jgi:hypothetical protein
VFALQLKWIGFLFEMLKEEEAKLKTRRKETKAAAKGERARPVNKTDFHRSIIVSTSDHQEHVLLC